MEKREYIDDPEETMRLAFASLMRSQWFVMPCVMTEDSKDGHSCVPMPSVKRSVTDPLTGQITYEDHPIVPEAPVTYAGGGGVTATHPIRKGDEGFLIVAGRSIDVVRQQGQTQQPLDDRQNHLGDAAYLPSYRTDPRKLQQVSNDAHHVRSDDKKVVAETHPANGITHKSVDPSTAPASESFDPFASASKFFAHALHPTNGILGQATDGGTTHSHGVDHGSGAWMSALNGEHLVRAHPVIGALLSALSGQHIVQAHPEQGVSVSSATAVNIASQGPLTLSAPPGMLSLPSKSVSSASLSAGAASANVGPLSGDVSGTLPNVQVVGLAHVAGQDQMLTQAATDSAAASAGVAVGSLYINTAVKSGVGVLAVRLA